MQRWKRNSQMAMEKHRKQLEISDTHGEELRLLVVEMLEQAEFWKQKAGDTAIWRTRLKKLLIDKSTHGGGDFGGGFNDYDQLIMSHGQQAGVRLGKVHHRWSTMPSCAYTNVEFARVFILTTDGTFFRV